MMIRTQGIKRIRPHRIHVSQGPEYQGETYIWCECLAGDENLTQRYSGDTHGALFEGESLHELIDYLRKHHGA
jgi:hypothetical protein